MRWMGTGWTLATGVAVALAGTVLATSAAGASRDGVTLAAGGRYVIYGKSVALSGRDTANGRGVAHATLTVQAQEFPFRGAFHTVATVHTDARGRYRTRVSPSHATRYRLSGNSGSRPSVIVYVVPKDVGTCNLCGVTSSGTHTLIVRDVATAPPGPIAFHGPEYFYYGVAAGSNQPTTVRRIKSVPLRALGANRFEATVRYTVHFPTARFRFLYVTCYRLAEAHDGLGLPGRHHCGEATLRSADLGHLGYVS